MAWSRSMIRALLITLALICLLPGPAFAAPPKNNETLLDYVKGRTDLSSKARARWTQEVKKRFGGAALKEETEETPEITVAKAILASAMFQGLDPPRSVSAAFEGYRGALGYVPPPIAIHYQLLALEGRTPRGRPIDLAFEFPKFYNDEIAPDLVEYWEQALARGKIPDFALEETKRALEETRVKMRPLLLDKLRLIARLARDRDVARAARRAEIEADIAAIEGELSRAFSGVARRPEVIDRRRRPYDRLRIQLEDMGLSPSEEDRLLDPDAPAPPPKDAPILEPPPPTPRPGEAELVEPVAPPRIPPPPQPRPGDPKPELAPLTKSGLQELIGRYRDQLTQVVTPWIGTPYEWGADLRGVGTDCSGFTRKVMHEGFALVMPRVSRDQFRVGRSVAKDELLPGDLVFFDTKDAGMITHVGVFTGGTGFAHASSSKGVVYANLGDKSYQRAYRGARRVLTYPSGAGRLLP